MKISPFLAAVAVWSLALLTAWPDKPMQNVNLVRIGRGFATTTKLRVGDILRIRVKEKGDGLQDAIVISSFTPAQIRLTRGSDAGAELKRWSKAEVEVGQVLVYTVEEPAHIGLELQGSTNSRLEVVRKEDHFEMTFSSITEKWVLEVKFTEPEF